MDGHDPSVFDLYSQAWFLQLWNQEEEGALLKE